MRNELKGQSQQNPSRYIRSYYRTDGVTVRSENESTANGRRPVPARETGDADAQTDKV